MGYQDLLLAVVSYPDPTPASAVAQAARLARRLGGAVTILALEADIPEMRNRLANALIGLDDIARDVEARSHAQARVSAKSFLEAAAGEGLSANAVVERAALYAESELICAHARTRDLCMISIGPVVQADVAIAEAVLFGAGRPVVVYPEAGAIAAGSTFGTVAVAWDASRSAARAVADALPVLREAREVRILTVTDEKPGVQGGAATELARHLRTHGVEAHVDEISAADEPIGRVMRQYVADRSVELLVMGGFGHSRALEFVLGGATASVLEAPPCPVLMSH